MAFVRLKMIQERRARKNTARVLLTKQSVHAPASCLVRVPLARLGRMLPAARAAVAKAGAAS